MTQEDCQTNNLKHLREEKNLSIADVASKLKLSNIIISKIENSDFNDLGAYTYIRGYIKHYTNLLGVDSEQYLELVPKDKFAVPLINTSSNLTKGIKLTRQSKYMASYLFGTFIVLIISFSGWFLLKNYSGFLVNKESITIVDNKNIEISPKSITEELHPEIEVLDNDIYHYSSIIPAIDENIKNQQDLIAIPSKIESSDDILVDKAQESIDSLQPSSYEIKIRALTTSWVKVELLDGSKLHNDLLKPGEIILNSSEPVHFRIGNEKQVKIVINGQEIELSKYSTKDIADFNWPLDS